MIYQIQPLKQVLSGAVAAAVSYALAVLTATPPDWIVIGGVGLGVGIGVGFARASEDDRDDSLEDEEFRE